MTARNANLANLTAPGPLPSAMVKYPVVSVMWSGVVHKQPALPTVALGHILDASTLALWRFDEAGAADVAADATTVYNLTSYGDPGVTTGNVGLARRLSNDKVLRRDSTAAFDTAIRGEVTVEAWVRVDPDKTLVTNGIVTIFIAHGSNFSTNADHAVSLDFALTIAPDGLANLSGNYHVNTSSVSGITANSVVKRAEWTHVAYRRKMEVGGTYARTLFVNGAVVATDSNKPGPYQITPGTTQRFICIAHYLDQNLVTAQNDGPIDISDLRISKMARTDAEIRESYRRGAVVEGHRLDGDTVAMWRMDETSGDAIDAAGNYNLTAFNTPSAQVGKVSGGRGFVNGFIDNGPHFRRAGDPTLTSLIAGNVTLEAWVWLDPTFDSASGDTFPSVFRYGDGAANGLYLCVRRGSGILRTVELAAGNLVFRSVEILSTGTWYHLAATHQYDPMTGVQTGVIYINGRAVKTGTLIGALPALSSPTMSIGKSNPGWGEYWVGVIDDIRLSKVVRTGTEILDSYMRGLGARASAVPHIPQATRAGHRSLMPTAVQVPLGHIQDANTLALWRLNETGTGALVNSAEALHLNRYGTGAVVAVPGVIGNGQRFNATSGAQTGTATTTHINVFESNHTVELWVKPRILPTETKRLFGFGRYNSNRFILQMSTTGSVHVSHTVAGKPTTDALNPINTVGIAALLMGAWTHVAVRKTVENPSEPVVANRTNTWAVFFNGVKVHETLGQVNAGPDSGGTGGGWSSSPLYTLGSYARILASEAGANMFDGDMDDIRVSRVARTDAEILDSYMRGDWKYRSTDEAPRVQTIQSGSEHITLPKTQPDNAAPGPGGWVDGSGNNFNPDFNS